MTVTKARATTSGQIGNSESITHTGVTTMQRIQGKILGTMAIALMSGSMAANAATQVLTWTSSENGGLSATATLDVVGGQVVSFLSGSITAAALDGGVTQALALILQGDGGTYNYGCNSEPTCFFYDFAGSNNVGWSGDALVPPTGSGLLFNVVDGNGSGFNPLSSVAYIAGVSPAVAGVPDLSGGGGWLTYSSVTYSAVPVPAAAWLFGSALGLLKVVRRRTA